MSRTSKTWMKQLKTGSSTGVGRRRALIAALLAAAPITGVATSAQAQSGPIDVRSIKPVMMLLVDTSGSMERMPSEADGSGCEDCLPTCNDDPVQDATQRNRWAVTLEALTGTFNDFRCRSVDRTSYPTTDYDYGYFLPHIDFTTNASQVSDGVLDAFEYRVKFGLMTFDGVGTTLGGDTLVAYNRWLSDTTFLNQANGSPGMYSYGRIGRLSFPNCQTDYGFNGGARGEGTHPGALISVGLNDDGVSTINQQIQASLLSVRPFGGTPIAAMLDDLEYYLTYHDDVREGSDPFYSCRKRYAILLTDGAPDALFRDPRFQCNSFDHSLCAGGTCECPYDTEVEIADRLRGDRLEKLWVVAYNVHDEDALTTLDNIAQAGGGENAITALSPAELRNILSQLMNLAQPDATSRSVPISLQSGGFVSAAGTLGTKVYDITAGFRLGAAADDPWQGLLYRRVLGCNGSTVDDSSTERDEFHEELTSQTSREVFSFTPPSAQAARGRIFSDYTPAEISTHDLTVYDNTRLTSSVESRFNLNKPDGSQFSSTPYVPDSSVDTSQDSETRDLTPVAFDQSLNSNLVGDADGNGVPGEQADIDKVVDFVLGNSRPNNKLGDIYHSNPVAVPPLSPSGTRYVSTDARYTQWLEDILSTTRATPQYGAGGRPGVIFVGTNDGILHAFNLDDWQSSSGATVTPGTELWGFVPPALFNKLASATVSHTWMFDGTPIVKDVILQRKADEPPLFRSVLVAAVRGAPAFVALDVSYPEEPRFMWQLSYPYLGDTVANPAVTQIVVEWNGTPQERGVAILPGGKGLPTASCASGYTLTEGVNKARYPLVPRDAVRCWQDRGRALYVVDLLTGELIQAFDPRHFPSPLVGSVAVDGPGTAFSQAAYFTDADGVLWRLSMANPDPSKWLVEPLWDLFAETATTPTWSAGRPALYAPTLGRDPNGNLVIAVGTGDVDNLTDTAHHQVLSLTEYRELSSGLQISGEVDLNWKLALEAGESVTGPLTLFQKSLYFGTFLSPSGPSADACLLGTSRLYGAHLYEDDGAENPMPRLPDPNAPAGSDQKTLRDDVDPSGTSLMLGVSISQQPICLAGSTVANPVTGTTDFVASGGVGGGLYELRAMLSGSGSGNAGQKYGTSEVAEMRRSIDSHHQTKAVGWASSVE